MAKAKLRGKRAMVAIYLDPPTIERMKDVSEQTGLPQAHHYRDAVNRFLDGYEIQRSRATDGPARNVHAVKRKTAAKAK